MSPLSQPYEAPQFRTATDVAAARALGTVYQNTGSNDRYVMAVINTNLGAQTYAYIGPADPPTWTVHREGPPPSSPEYTTCTFIVPPGWYYEIVSAGSPGIGYWVEVQ